MILHMSSELYIAVLSDLGIYKLVKGLSKTEISKYNNSGSHAYPVTSCHYT